MGKGDTYGHPGCLPQRKGDNNAVFFLDRLIKVHKVEPSGFSSTKLLAELIRDTEEMYRIHFGEHGVFHSQSMTDSGRDHSSW